MPTYIAPGVYVEERDFSDYIAALATTPCGLIGAAKRGPLNQPTLITSAEQFVETFGEPTVNDFGSYAAINYLRRGNQLWYNRVAKTYTETTTLESIGVADADGGYRTFTVGAGHSIVAGDYVQITQSGKPTSQSLKVLSVAVNEITVNNPLSDSTYDDSGSSDSEVNYSLSSNGIGSSEVFAPTRSGNAVSRLIKFTAKDPGQWANFGSSEGIEIKIEDGGQFANLDVATGTPQVNSQNIPLQGVQPSGPSVDQISDLYSLDSNVVRVGDMRGVNRVAPLYPVSEVEVVSATEIKLVIAGEEAASSFAATDDINLVGLDVNAILIATGDYSDGVHTIDSVGTSGGNTEIGVIGFTGLTIAASTAADPGGFIEDVDKATRNALVFYCTSVSATGSAWEARGVLTKRLKVFYQGRQQEVFENLIGYDSTSPNYWDNAIGNAIGTSRSRWIYCDYYGVGEQPINTYNRVNHPNNPRLLMGLGTSIRIADSGSAALTTLSNGAGNDGSSPEASDYIGTINSSGDYSGLQHFRRVELYDIAVLAVPGISTPSVIEEMLSLLAERNDCLGLIDPPFGLSPQQVVDWHNGQGVYAGLHDAFTGNQGAMYYPWVKQHDPYTRADVWLPPSAIMPGVMAYNDRVGESWYAPAGIVRGKVPNAIAAERVLTRGDVEYFYGPGSGNAVNPIMSFARDGVTVYGNRTLQRHPSAFDRVNVRRLLFYIEKAVATAARSLNFEQNDPILWATTRGLIEPFLTGLQGRRAIEWFKVVCDETTNTPERRNNNESKAKVYIIPTKSAEKLILDFTLFASGANVQELIDIDSGQNGAIALGAQ